MQDRLLKEEKELKVALMTSAKGSERQCRKLSIVSKLLKEYAELVESQRNLLSLSSPDTTAFDSLIRFVDRHKNDLSEEDYDWIFRADDLMTLWPYAENTMLEDVIEAFLVIIPQKLFPSFAVSDQLIVRVCCHDAYLAVPSHQISHQKRSAMLTIYGFTS